MKRNLTVKLSPAVVLCFAASLANAAERGLTVSDDGEMHSSVVRESVLDYHGARIATLVLYSDTRTEFQLVVGGCAEGRGTVAALIHDDHPTVDQWRSDGDSMLDATTSAICRVAPVR